MKRTIAFILAALILSCTILTGQTKFSGKVEIDNTIHDFGDVYMSEGPVSHSFNVKNIGNDNVTILSVVSSCGCTDVTWTRNELKPGASGKISATYSNDEGPYPFDKTLTVYVSDINKPIVLHLRGTSRQKALPLDQAYPVHFGNLALKETEIRVGNLSQGEQRGGQVKVANIGKSPLKLSFKDVSPNLSISVTPETIPAGGTGTIVYNVAADRSNWGKCWYYATPLVNGQVMKSTGEPENKSAAAGGDAIVSEPNPELGKGSYKIGFWAFTKENFSGITKEARKNAPIPSFKNTTFTFGKAGVGTKVKAEFEITNTGKEPLVIYKADCDTRRASFKLPQSIAAGKSGKLVVEFDTKGLEKGEATIMINLTTNSPVRPLVALCVTGFLN